MARSCPYSIGELLPHQPPMLLLEEFLSCEDATLVASVIITESSLFLTPHGVPGHVALEYMAQTCGAYAGVMALKTGAPVKIGFLLGTRLCRVMVPWFHVGEQLIISAYIVFHDEQLAAFDCKIEIDGRLVADAQLKVYQPDDDSLPIDE